MKTAIVDNTDQPAHQLPHHRTETTQGSLTLHRVWPVPEEPDAERTLAVEFADEHDIRAGWWRAGALELLAPGADPKLRALPALLRRDGEGPPAKVVSHRPGKRAVVRTEADGRSVFVKVVRRRRAPGILDGVQRAQSFNGPFRLPRMRDHTDSTVTFDALSGVSLHSPSPLSTAEWGQAWAEVCHAWAESVRNPRRSATPALVHRAESEVGVLRHWFHLTAPYLEDRDQTERKLETISAKLLGLAEDRLVPAHRDLHDKQLLWSAQQGPGLLDVDTACLADPALDLGNLRAHALLRQLQGVWSAGHSETVRFCVDDTAESASVPRHALALYEQAAQLRLGLVYAVRPQYTDVAAELRENC